MNSDYPGSGNNEWRLAWITDLMASLQEAHYTITSDDCVKAGYIVRKFLEQHDVADVASRRKLSELVGPIVCSNSAQQKNFYTIFEEVFQRNWGGTVRESAGSAAVPPKTLVDREVRVSRRKYLVSLISFVVIVGIAIVVLFSKEISQRFNSSVPADTSKQVSPSNPTGTTSSDNLKDEKRSPADTSGFRPQFQPLQTLSEVVGDLVPDRFRWAALALIVAGVAGTLLFKIIYSDVKVPLFKKGPFNLQLPSGAEYVQASPEFEAWAKQLQQREQGNYHLIDVKRTISATVHQGGFPRLMYKRPERRPHYLILIDSRSPYDQQTKLYSYLAGHLFQSGIDLTTYYFHTTPDFCWTERNPQGIKTQALYQRFSESYVVIISDGISLLDEERKPANWVTSLFGSWQRRAVFTPRQLDDWGVYERAISSFFALLPISPFSMPLLRPFMDQDRLPFNRLRDTLRKRVPGSGFKFNSELEEITYDDVKKYITNQLVRHHVSSPMYENICAWALSTVLSIKPSLEITIAIGRAIEKSKNISGLVSTDHLMIVAGLPWLAIERIPISLRDRLLENLRAYDKSSVTEPKIEKVAREAIIGVLEKTNPVPGTRAFQEKEIALAEQTIQVNASSRLIRHAIRKLRSFQNAGLIFDRTLISKINSYYFSVNWKMISLLAVFFLLSTYVVPPLPPEDKDTLAANFLFVPANATDSAVYFNNKASEFYDTMTREQDTFKKLFPLAVENCLKSIQVRPTKEAFQNLLNLRYAAAAAVYMAGKRDSARIILNEVPALLTPFHAADPRWVPSCDQLSDFFRLLAGNDSAGVVDYIVSLLDDSPRIAKIFRGNVSPTMIANAQGALLSNVIDFRSIPFARKTTVEIPPAIFEELESFRGDHACRKIHLYYNGERLPENKDQLQNARIAGTTLRKNPRSTSTAVIRGESEQPDQSQEETLDSIAVTGYGSTEVANEAAPSEDSVSDVIVDVAQQTPNQSVNPFDSTAGQKVEIEPDSLGPAYENEEPTNEKKDEFDNYGVLNAEVRSIAMKNRSMIIIATAGNSEYAIELYADRDQRIAIRRTPPGAASAVNFNPGFNTLPQEREAGALDYVEDDVQYTKEYLTLDMLYKDLLSRWMNQANIYVWGTIDRIESDRSGRFVITNVQMNQGSSRPEDVTKNGRWRDGAIMFTEKESNSQLSKGESQVLTVYIYHSFQSFNVDEQGNPVKASRTKKKKESSPDKK
jgi:hypothetical protein